MSQGGKLSDSWQCNCTFKVAFLSYFDIPPLASHYPPAPAGSKSQECNRVSIPTTSVPLRISSGWSILNYRHFHYKFTNGRLQVTPEIASSLSGSNG